MSSFGNTTTTTGSTTGTNTSSSMQQATPQDTAFINSLYPQMSNLLAQSQKPVYGQAQEAGMLNSVNRATNSGLNSLAGQLAARTGSVNSGAFATGAQNMLGQRSGIMSNYAMQTPLLNQQAQQQGGLQAMQMANALAGPALRGQTGGGTQSGTSNQTTEQNSGWGNMLMSGLGSVAGLAMGSPGGLMGLGKSLLSGAPQQMGYSPFIGNGGSPLPFGASGIDSSGNPNW